MKMDKLDDYFWDVVEWEKSVKFDEENADADMRLIHKTYFDGLRQALQHMNDPRILRLIEVNPEQLSIIIKLHSERHEAILDAQTPYDDDWVMYRKSELTKQTYRMPNYRLPLQFYSLIRLTSNRYVTE